MAEQEWIEVPELKVVVTDRVLLRAIGKTVVLVLEHPSDTNCAWEGSAANARQLAAGLLDAADEAEAAEKAEEN